MTESVELSAGMIESVSVPSEPSLTTTHIFTLCSTPSSTRRLSRQSQLPLIPRFALRPQQRSRRGRRCCGHKAAGGHIGRGGTNGW